MMSRRRAAGVGGWFASLRFSGFTLLAVGLIIIGALALAPAVSTFVQQQREIAELRASVELHRNQVAEIDAERLKWQDPAYVRAQARGRLFYVMPGETQLSVISDVIIPAESEEETQEKLSHLDRNWAQEIAVSTLRAGVTEASPEELLGTEEGNG